jgi:hypothetical protein
MVTERLLIAIGEQDERYGSERYGDQRSEGGAQIGFPIVGCLVVRHRDLRLSALCRQRLHRIEVPARVATRRNPALRRKQAPSGSRCCRFRLGAALADDGCRPAESDGYHQKSLKLETSYHATPISSPLTLIAANANNPSIRLMGSSIPNL